nr:hypothetical protein [Tanacetum cinerariifolium]
RRSEVKELKERCAIKAFKLSNQESYEHVSPKVTSSQDGKRSHVDGTYKGHIPRVGTQVAEKGKTLIFGSQPQGMYTDVEIDDMLASRDKLFDAAKKEAKRQKQEIDMLRRVVMSDDRFSQLLTQLGS